MLSISAFTSVVSARLTVSRLAINTIDSLTQLDASDLCVEATYPAVVSLVSGEFALNGDLRGAGVMLGTPQSCVEAVQSGAALAYLSDAPLLKWLAYGFYAGGDLYVSETIRANPLTLAYPSGSTLRPHADSAVITLLTSTTWSSARDALARAWFPQGDVVLSTGVDAIDKPLLASACTLLFLWLAGMVWSCSRKALRDTRMGRKLQRVSTAMRAAVPGAVLAAAHEAPEGMEPHEGGAAAAAAEAVRAAAATARDAAQAAAQAQAALAEQAEQLRDLLSVPSRSALLSTADAAGSSRIAKLDL